MSIPRLTYRDGAGVRVNLEALIASRLLIQANSGGGKSHAIRQLLEETHGKVQHIIIDREGEFSSLRERLPYLLVGAGGEVAVDLASAPTLARKLLELGVNAIVDLSEIALPAQRQYVAAFFNAMSEAPRALWHDVLVILDEGHLFAPQKFKKGEKFAADSLAAVSLAASIWRKRGFCLGVATQRIAKLDNDVAAELLNKLIGRTSEEDRKRAADELGMSNEASRALKNLEPGTFWAYGPAIGSDPVQCRTAQDLKTRPPKRGAAREAAPPTPAAIRAIADALAELPKEAAEEAHTVEGLKRQLAEANRKVHLAQRSAAAAVVVKPDPKAIEQAVARERVRIMREAHAERDAFITAAGRHIRTFEKFAGELEAQGRWVLDAAVRFKNSLPNAGKGYGGSVTSVDAVAVESHRTPAVVRRVERSVPIRNNGTGDSSLPKGEKIVLTAIAQHTDGVTREQLTVLTGFKRSTRDAYIQRLYGKDLIESGGTTIRATQAGVDALGDFEPLPTGSELRDYWLTEGRLPDGERKVLELLASGYPETIDRTVIDATLGYARSSRDAYIQRLSARKLVVTGSAGVRMSENLDG